MEKFENDGLTFDVQDSGEREPTLGTVVLLHGFPQTSQIWAGTAAILDAAGYRAVAFDQRGYSPGARPAGRRNYRIQLLAGDAAALVEALDVGPVHLVGHDWGAVVAWELAASRPDLVASLTTVSVPAPGAFLASLASSPQLLRSWYMGFFQLPFAVEALATRAPGVMDRLLRSAGMEDDQIAAFHRDIVGSGALTTAVNWYRALPFAGPGSLRRHVSVPTAHVWGEGDAALDRRGVELAGDYVDAPFELHVIGDGGHWLPERNPAEVAEAVLGVAGREG